MPEIKINKNFKIHKKIDNEEENITEKSSNN